MKDNFIKTKKHAENTRESNSASPSEYAASSLQGNARDTIRAVVPHLPDPRKELPVYMSHAKSNILDVKRIADSVRKHRSVMFQRKALKRKMSPANSRGGANPPKNANRIVKSQNISGESSFSAVKPLSSSIKVKTNGAAKSFRYAVKAPRAASVRTHAAANKSFAAARAAGRKVKSAGESAALFARLSFAALKSLVSALIAGGLIAVMIIVVIALIALLFGSAYGIFFSGADSGTGRTMPAVVSELTAEFYAGVEEISASHPHDVLDMEAASINWIDVLAVYAVKINSGQSNAAEVATLDDDKADRLRGVLFDMASLSYRLKTETHDAVTESGGSESSESVTVTTLVITISQKSADDMCSAYGFSNTQRAMLSELLLPEHSALWAALLGGYAAGNGEILIYTGSLTPNSIFSWPLAADYPVTSFFGYRKDPFTDETKYHGGIDIAAPFGTPVLAAADGVVAAANSTDMWGGGYGYHVEIQHGGSFATLYAHCSEIAVVKGQEVKKGEVIAYVGSTGRSTGNHLHWEISKDGIRADPLSCFE